MLCCEDWKRESSLVFLAKRLEVPWSATIYQQWFLSHLSSLKAKSTMKWWLRYQNVFFPSYPYLFLDSTYVSFGGERGREGGRGREGEGFSLWEWEL